MEEPSELYNLEEKRTVFNSLYDSLVQYLKPEAIISHSAWFTEFLQGPSTENASVQSLFSRILEEETGEAISQFEVALRQLTSDPANLSSAVVTDAPSERSYMKHLVKLLDGTLVKALSKSEVSIVLDLMLEEKMITKKHCDQAKERGDPLKCCLKMFKNISRGKPNWPFVFIKAVSKTRPDLIQPESAETFQPAGGISQIDDQRVTLDELSEFTNSYVNEEIMYKVHMSEEERSSVKVQRWLATGNFDESNIISEEKYQEWMEKHHVNPKHDFSDDEEDNKENQNLSLRGYQEELAETALKGDNTIIWAPTGSGKTRVAIHIILRHLEQQVDNVRRRKVAFFARTVPLVMQQYRCIMKSLPSQFRVTNLTGDNKNCLHMDEVIPKYDVIVMTPRILENHLEKRKQDHLDIFSLLVFDECHHTRKGEPYNTLMYHYLKRKKQIDSAQRGEQTVVTLPQIVGLTASISVENAKTDKEAVENILQVCGNLDVDNISCVVENIEELRKIVPKCEEDLQVIYERKTDDAVRKIMKKMKDFEERIIDLAKKIKNEQLDELTAIKSIPPNKKSLQYGHWSVKVQNAAKSVPRKKDAEANGWKRSLIILSDYLATYNVALELHDLVLLRDVVAYLEKCFEKYRQNRDCTDDENIYFESFSELKETMGGQLDSENPNLAFLKKCLLRHIVGKGELSRGMVFVRTRALAKALTSWLNSCGDREIEDLDAKVFTGTNATAADGGMTVAQQKEVIHLFSNGQVRLIVATSVAEEGIDIPECNLVIKYNYVGNEITTVQTRGRTRKRDGMSIILAMDKIIVKEKLNRERAKMMENAINHIRGMETSHIQRKNKTHQQNTLTEGQRNEEQRQREKSQLLQQPFKMVCHGCGFLAIGSRYIRTMYHAHRIVINSNIFYKTKTYANTNAVSFDDVHVIGPVLCKGSLKGGKHCNNKIGTLMIFSNVPFIVLKAGGLGYETSEKSRLQNFKKWKSVPYAVDEIDPLDFESYLPDPGVTEQSEDNSLHGDGSSTVQDTETPDVPQKRMKLVSLDDHNPVHEKPNDVN